MINLLPNTGSGAKFANWTPTVLTGTVLVHTYSATSGGASTAIATPGVLLSCTGTTATLSLVSGSISVSGDEWFGFGFTAKCSNTANSLLVPFTITFYDGLANVIETYIPIASAAAASTSAIAYMASATAPVGSVYMTVALGQYSWSSTGGYTITYSSPGVFA